MSIDPNRPLPLYLQLKTLLLEEMLQGIYRPGDRLPTEQAICQRYGISRTPVTRAFSELAEEGVVLRHRGRGTFVNPLWVPRRGDRTEIRVMVPAEGPWESIVREASPDDMAVTIAVVPRADLHHALTRAVAEGQAPDLAVLDSVWVPEFASAGFLHALEEIDLDWVTGEFRDDFLEPLVEATAFRGQTFAVSAVADVAGIWYRRNELESRGLALPRTWDDLLEVAGRLGDDGLPHPVVMAAGTKGGDTTIYCLTALLASNSASVLNEYAVTLDTLEAVQVVQFLRRLVERGLLSAEAVGYDWNRPIRLLAQGRAAISFGGSYEAGTLSELLGISLEALGDHFEFTAVPAGPAGAAATVTGTMVYGIFRQATHPKQALRLLRHVVAPETLALVAHRTGRIPPRRSAVALAARESDFVARTAGLLANAVTRPATPVFPRVAAQLAVMVESVLTGRFEPPAAVERTAEMIGAITGLPVLRPAGYAPPRRPAR